MMTLVTNVTLTRVASMYKCLLDSYGHTHLPLASLTLSRHSHAHYLTNMGGCNPNDTYPCTISFLPFLLGASADNSELVTLEVVTLTLLGTLAIFWRILAPKTDTNYIQVLSNLMRS